MNGCFGTTLLTPPSLASRSDLTCLGAGYPSLDPHTCLLGPNGTGKSTVLAALNVFFQETSSTTEVTSLFAEDFHIKDSEPDQEFVRSVTADAERLVEEGRS